MSSSAIARLPQLKSICFGKHSSPWLWRGLPWPVCHSAALRLGWGRPAPKVHPQQRLKRHAPRKPSAGQSERWDRGCRGMAVVLPRHWRLQECCAGEAWRERSQLGLAQARLRALKPMHGCESARKLLRAEMYTKAFNPSRLSQGCDPDRGWLGPIALSPCRI